MRTPRLLITLVVVSLLITIALSLRSYRGLAADSPGRSVSEMNDPPTAVDDSYTLHTSNTAFFLTVLANDSNPEGDGIVLSAIVSPAQHGTAQIGAPIVRYTPTVGYTGGDSFSYRVCDFQDNCSMASVQLTLVNSTPVAVDDNFTIRGLSHINFIANDSDADGDVITIEGHTETQHGLLRRTASPKIFQYLPVPLDFVGTDSFTYQTCDEGGACSSATVTLYIIGDGENDGATSCNTHIGEPVNVTNGNMFVEQSDSVLPGVGPGLTVARTYNSNSQRTGLFGRGWTTEYDEELNVYDGNLVRLNRSDGRAIYFGRPVNSTSSMLSSIAKDFHGGLSQNGSGFTLTFKNGGVHQFNALGKLTSLVDRFGNQTSLNYDAGGKLVSVIDPFGRVLSFVTNSNGRALTISDSMGTIATYAYGASNQLLSVTYADSSAFQFAYDTNLRLTTVIDALGNIVESHSYDSDGRAITSEKQGGIERYSLNYVSDTETDVTDALGHMTKYTLDKSRGRNVVTRIEGVCGCGGGNSQVQSWTYDEQLNVTSVADALNHVTSFTYDADGNRQTTTNPTGTITYTYGAFGQLLTTTNQLNGVTTNTYDSVGKLLTTTDALNNVTSFTYNSRGQMLTATDARGKVTAFTYDSSGNLVQRRDANNITTFLFYDARSRITKVRDALSRSTLFAYDAAGRLNKVTLPDLSTIAFTYDLAGRRIRVTDERGNPTSYVYDTANRLTGVTDALNRTMAYGYDAMSKLTSVTDPLMRITNYEYDSFDRLVKVTYPPATAGATRLFETSSYDANGNVTSRTDTAGRVSSFTYDNLNRPASETDANNKTSSFEYDALSRNTAVVDALGQRYQFAYDLLGRQTGTTRAGQSTTYTFDAVGNSIQRTDFNGLVTNYSYDNLNRLTTIAYPNRTVSYAYDALNNLTRATNENGSIYIGYDNRYRVSSFSDPFYYGISYNYDAAGNRTKLKINGATYATYTYDAVNRLTNLADGANLNFAFTYDAADRMITRTAPNGVSSNYAYDDLDRVTALSHVAGANTLNANQYTYNNASNIASWFNASGNHAYSYDLVDRLTAVNNSSQAAENYSYDAVGNRTAAHLSASYNFQPFNRLTATASATYSYDNNGNLLSKTDAAGTTSFAWTEENQLKQVIQPNGLTVNYTYDALGRRLQRTNNAGASERYVYDRDDVLLDLNADWSVGSSYLNAPGVDNHLRQTASSGSSYFLTDHQGSTAALTDAAGNVLEQQVYDSFGQSAGSTRTRYGYTGRERDPDNGLLYYRARWYDPELGRFISEDPIGLAGGINQFAYVGNNPGNGTDPSGLFNEDVHYYLTYYLATKLSCLTAHEARLIAEADQSTDENDDTKPLPGLTPGHRKTNADSHAFNEGNEANLSALRTTAMGGGINYVAAGRYLHHLQDTYSHRGFHNPWYGQYGFNGYDVPVLGGLVVDNTNHDLPKSEEMARATFFALYEFAKKKGCECKFAPLNSWWPTVSAFLRANNGDLDNKRRILGVPLR